MAERGGFENSKNYFGKLFTEINVSIVFYLHNRHPVSVHPCQVFSSWSNVTGVDRDFRVDQSLRLFSLRFFIRKYRNRDMSVIGSRFWRLRFLISSDFFWIPLRFGFLRMELESEVVSSWFKRLFALGEHLEMPSHLGFRQTLKHTFGHQWSFRRQSKWTDIICFFPLRDFPLSFLAKIPLRNEWDIPNYVASRFL